MADNVTLLGEGQIVATDEIGGAHYQKIKLIDPTTDSSAAIGIAGNPLIVSGAMTVSGVATAANQTTVIGNDPVSGLDALRVMGYDLDSGSWNPIPTRGFGTYLPVSVNTGIYGSALSNTGTITGAAQTVILNTLDGYFAGIFSIRGTYNAEFIFEGLRDSTWGPIFCTRVGAIALPSSVTGALLNDSRVWRCNATGYETIRIRCTAYASGTANISIGLSALGESDAVQLIGGGQTTMANSTCITIASDQTAGVFATAALQSAGNSHLSAISGNVALIHSDLTTVITDIERGQNWEPVSNKYPTCVAAQDTSTFTWAPIPMSAGGLVENLTYLGGTAVAVNSGNKSAGTLRTVLATDQPELTNAQPVKSKVATPTTGTITAISQTVTATLSGELALLLEYSGPTYAGIQIQYEASYDNGSSYRGIYGYNYTTATYANSSTIDSNQTRDIIFSTPGVTNFRVRSTSYTSGTMNIRILPVSLGQGPNYVTVVGAVSAAIASTTFTAADGNAAPSESAAIGFFDTDAGAWVTLGGSSAPGQKVFDVTWPVAGDWAHDTADAGNPVKIGAKAIDMSPSSSGERGPTDVAANDRVNALYDLKGRMIEVPACEYTTLSAINTTYNNTTTTATSANITCWQYRQATLSFEITVASTPTLILFEVEVSLDGTNYETLVNDGLGAIVYSQATITAATTLKRSYTFPIACQKIRVKVTATGTDASKTFTVDKSVLYLRN